MEPILLDKVMKKINSLHTWECSLNFKDERFPGGITDLCQYLDSKSDNAVLPTSTLPTNCYYYFDDKLYGDGSNSEEKLLQDIINAARNCGFRLIVRNSTTKNLGAPWTKKILLACNRGKIYEGNKLQEMENTYQSNGRMGADLLCQESL